MKKLILILLLCSKLSTQAQDIIVKSDRTEIKAKVAEITESLIKYKNWDNLDGPLYNISKTAVFMIIYANGKRETIAQPSAPTQSTNPPYQNTAPAMKMAAAPTGSVNKSGIDTVIDYKKIRVKYAPSHVIYWFDSPPTTVGVHSELRIIKNLLNFGGGGDYSFITGAQQTMYSAYLSPYLPLNRLTKNYKKQDQGLFVFAKIGYASISYEVDGYTSSTGDVTAGIGMDYFFTKHLGLSISADKFGDGKFNVKGGICFK
ncbi:MAG TPA: hypothetical protein VL307_08885 [Chitinophagaceae bacterium]|jgi:hypothetical protein|nr:hypothetical protein [Chitinophagaceae bacterium]